MVRNLYQQDERFSWDYINDGCFARAQGAVDYFREQGISEDLIEMQIIAGPRLGTYDKFGEKIQWNYHIAPLLTLENGKRMVVDPSVDSEKALDAWEWGERIQIDRRDRISERSQYLPEKKLVCPMSQQLFHTSKDFSVSFSDLDGLTVYKVDSITRKRFQNRLDYNRQELMKKRAWKCITSAAESVGQACLEVICFLGEQMDKWSESPTAIALHQRVLSFFSDVEDRLASLNI